MAVRAFAGDIAGGRRVRSGPRTTTTSAPLFFWCSARISRADRGYPFLLEVDVVLGVGDVPLGVHVGPDLVHAMVAAVVGLPGPDPQRPADVAHGVHHRVLDDHEVGSSGTGPP